MGSTVIGRDGRENDCLQQLKLSIKENPELVNIFPISDDRFLLHFVRGRKYDPKSAYFTLVNYIKVRTVSYPELFLSLRPTTNSAICHKISRVLKQRDQQNRIVGITRLRFWDPSNVSTESCIQLAVLFLEEAWNLEDVERDGFVLIFDLAQYNLKHAGALLPSHVRQIINIIWKAFPLRLKGIHFVNEIYLFTMLLQTVRTFLPKKVRERLFVHSSNYESLHEHVPRSILPKSLGGILSEEEAYDFEFEERILQKDAYYEAIFK